ncbi:MAG: hypothetical protein AVDCRST_MAG01-01-1663, partial [uncultured Rubrobacteraceae bacterium]
GARRPEQHADEPLLRERCLRERGLRRVQGAPRPQV